MPVVEMGPGARTDDNAKVGNAKGRLRSLVDAHYDFVWRTLRYMGMPDATAEDAAQEVMCVLARRIDQVAHGAEMSFLFSTAMRVASEARRSARRRPAASDQDIEAISAQAPSADDLVDQRQALALLRHVLDALPVDLRVVFILFELEELTIPEVSALVGIPTGTAASRLRRAREHFQGLVQRLRASGGREFKGGGRT
jgi:RNA polymerase sigma-70 factor (ECF subfamily)